MLNTSALTLIRLAALVWYIGVVVLLIKSSGLFLKAERGGADSLLLVSAVLGGLAIGWVKAKYLFVKVCNRNLERINALKQPRLWQFYRLRFFFFLGLMIAFGNYLPRLAQGDFRILIALGVVELSVATALLVSSQCFWRTEKGL